LRIVGNEEPVSDLILRVEVGYLLAGKVCPIVRDNGEGASKVTHDVLPRKLDNLLISDFVEWHRFDLSSEVVGDY